MKYLVELIKDKKPELNQDAIEYVISFLIKEGHVSYTVQYHFEIYDFYQKALERYNELALPRKCAFIDTMDHFKVSRPHLYRIIKSFSNK